MLKLINRALSWSLLLVVISSTGSVYATDYSSNSFIVRDPVIGQGLQLNSSTSYQLQAGIAANALGAGDSLNFSVTNGASSNDETPPLGGAVNDGAINQQSTPNTIAAGWFGFTDPESGVVLYEYRLKRTMDNKCWGDTAHLWLPCDIWNSTGTTTSYSISHANLLLRANTFYITCVRATNGDGLTSAVRCSNGAKIAELTSFSYDSTGVTLPLLSPANANDITGATRLSVNTNAYHGYTVYGSKSGPLTSLSNPSDTIPDISDGGCSGTAVSWPGTTGFGFSSSADVDGNKFHSSGTKYCSIPNSSNPLLGMQVAHVTSVTEGGLLDNSHDMTYRVQINFDQAAGDYTTNILYTIIPNY